jgi:hypothetical protein
MQTLFLYKQKQDDIDFFNPRVFLFLIQTKGLNPIGNTMLWYHFVTPHLWIKVEHLC